MSEIRKAKQTELDAIIDFYYRLIDKMHELPFNPIWEKDVYPTRDFVSSSIENEEFYIMTDGSDIIAASVLNHSLDGYDDVKWTVDAKKDQVLVLHAVAVSPEHLGKGYGKQMVRFAIETAKATDMKTVRLDVFPGNTPAERAYLSEGFRYVDTKAMCYGNAGVRSYSLYEYPVASL